MRNNNKTYYTSKSRSTSHVIPMSESNILYPELNAISDPFVKSCMDMKMESRFSETNVYTLMLTSGVRKDIYCDMTTDGGGWTVSVFSNTINDFETKQAALSIFKCVF